MHAWWKLESVFARPTYTRHLTKSTRPCHCTPLPRELEANNTKQLLVPLAGSHRSQSRTAPSDARLPPTQGVQHTRPVHCIRIAARHSCVTCVHLSWWCGSGLHQCAWKACGNIHTCHKVTPSDCPSLSQATTRSQSRAAPLELTLCMSRGRTQAHWEHRLLYDGCTKGMIRGR
jgi:hypothetical protein